MNTFDSKNENYSVIRKQSRTSSPKSRSNSHQKLLTISQSKRNSDSTVPLQKPFRTAVFGSPAKMHNPEQSLLRNTVVVYNTKFDSILKKVIDNTSNENKIDENIVVNEINQSEDNDGSNSQNDEAINMDNTNIDNNYDETQQCQHEENKYDYDTIEDSSNNFYITSLIDDYDIIKKHGLNNDMEIQIDKTLKPNISTISFNLNTSFECIQPTVSDVTILPPGPRNNIQISNHILIMNTLRHIILKTPKDIQLELMSLVDTGHIDLVTEKLYNWYAIKSNNNTNDINSNSNTFGNTDNSSMKRIYSKIQAERIANDIINTYLKSYHKK